MRSILLFISFSLFLMLEACIRNSQGSSELKSLTSEELESCKFKGKRYFVFVSPYFENDVPAMQDIFVKFHSDNQFMKASYIQNKLKDHPECKSYWCILCPERRSFSYDTVIVPG